MNRTQQGSRNGAVGVGVAAGPTVTTIPDLVIVRNGTSGPIAFRVVDDDGGPQLVYLDPSSSDTNLVPKKNIVIAAPAGVRAVDRTITVTPATNRTGQATITINAYDTPKFAPKDRRELPSPRRAW